MYGAGLLAVIGLFACYMLTRPGRYDPFGEFTEQTIVGSRSVPQGGVLQVRATKCYRPNGGHLIPVKGASYWVSIDPPHLTGGTAREARCYTTVFENRVPDDLPAGRWRLEGQETSVRGSEVASVAWRTEVFTVTAKETP